MKIKLLFVALVSVMAGLGACQSQPEYCTVKGTVKGLKDGTKLELQDEYDHFNVIGTVRVKDGAYAFHPCVSGPTHVYLFTGSGHQLKDFYLEPGTIIADLDDTDEDDWAIGASGTPSNDFGREVDLLFVQGEEEAALKRWNDRIDGGENGILALYYAHNVAESAVKALEVLDRLSTEIASKPYVGELREDLTRRAKTEPAPEGSGKANYFIDMAYPDADGNLVSLSSVVNNPANRYVLLDFWATWCDPCVEAIPGLKELYAKYHGKGLEIYSVSEDAKEANWKSFLAENGMTWINVLDDNAGRKNSKVWFEYALHGIPTMLLIDGETGEILLRNDEKELERVLSTLLQ